MGTPKALLPFPGKPKPDEPAKTLLEHLLGVMRHPHIGLHRIVLGAHADEIRRKVRLDPETLVINHDWEKGQLSSVQVALCSLPVGATQGMLLCLVDHPMISAELVGRLIDAFYGSGQLIALPTYHGKRGHPVIFSSRLYGELLTAPHEIGARAVVWAHANRVVEVPTEEEGVILNLNDPETYQRIARNA